MTAPRSHSSRSIVRMGYVSVLLASFGAAILVAHEIRDEIVLPVVGQPGDDMVGAASSCPVLACGSLVIDYRPADSVRPSHPEDWELTCSVAGWNLRSPKVN